MKATSEAFRAHSEPTHPTLTGTHSGMVSRSACALREIRCECRFAWHSRGDLDTASPLNGISEILAGAGTMPWNEIGGCGHPPSMAGGSFSLSFALLSKSNPWRDGAPTVQGCLTCDGTSTDRCRAGALRLAQGPGFPPLGRELAEPALRRATGFIREADRRRAPALHSTAKLRLVRIRAQRRGVSGRAARVCPTTSDSAPRTPRRSPAASWPCRRDRAYAGQDSP